MHLFSDSTIVLPWIVTPPHLLKTCVCNRIIKIQDLNHRRRWMHIYNSYTSCWYCFSWGGLPTCFLKNSLSWYGLEFLYQDINAWDLANAQLIELVCLNVNIIKLCCTLWDLRTLVYWLWHQFCRGRLWNKRYLLSYLLVCSLFMFVI